MECTVRWVTAKTFLGETGSGHTVVMDGPVEAGGRNLAPRPMEMLLAGAGGCTLFDVVAILEKGRQQVTDCAVHVLAERAETDPKVFTRIHFHYRLAGKGLDPNKVKRAIELSAEKYCSASIMLGKTATITHTWEIVAAEEHSA